MKCQTCPDTVLVLNDMQGIEVDRCPNCRGVWLDCGELDSIIDRSERGRAPSLRRNAGSWAEISDAQYSVHASLAIPRRRKSILGGLIGF